MAPPDKNAGSGQSSRRESAADEPARPPYEQARDELTELVRRLEAGGLTLEESLRLWERGEELAGICEEWLEGARARLAAALDRTADPDKPGQAPGAPF
ncbi:MAG TPA: exodeoxyribonuclease VII small subunit [Streptosporangiaceae bacterium]|nr:exodeoxyribonuclease VII small subunit [Streptosporangiaceae bacterium]